MEKNRLDTESRWHENDDDGNRCRLYRCFFPDQECSTSLQASNYCVEVMTCCTCVRKHLYKGRRKKSFTCKHYMNDL